MTRPGRVVFNTRERAVSNDMVRLQDLFGQDVMEVVRGLGALSRSPAAGTESDRKVVYRGLGVVPGAGMSVDVREGYAGIQRSGGAASADLSLQQLAHNRATANQVVNASDPVLNRVDLIEVQASDDTTETQLRDVYDPVTGTFAPVAVAKVIRPGCTLVYTAAVAGANPTCPAFSAAALNRVPIAAVCVPAAAAGFVSNNVVDLRPLWAQNPFGRMHGIIAGFTLETSDLGGDSATIVINPGVAIVDGQLVYRSVTHTLTIADHVPSGLVLAAETWYYVYLFAGRQGGATDFKPRHTDPGSASREGFVLVTDTPPTALGTPTGVVNLPASWAAGHIYGGTHTAGLYLGAVKTAGAATEVRAFRREGEWVRLSNQNVLGDVAFTYPGAPGVVTIDLGASQRTPSHCTF